jgi:hypothetical protein
MENPSLYRTHRVRQMERVSLSYRGLTTFPSFRLLILFVDWQIANSY